MRLPRRSILWLLPLIVAPLIALLAMQYRFLRTLERTTASAERNLLRGGLEDAADAVENDYRSAIEGALDVTPAMLEQPDALAAHFHGRRVGGARTYFAARFQPQGEQFASYDARGKQKALANEEGEAVKIASVSWAVLYKMKAVIPAKGMAIDTRDPVNRLVLRPVTDERQHVIGIAGLVLDMPLAHAHILKVAGATVKRHFPNDPYVGIRVGKPEVFAVKREREFMTQQLGGVFGDWRLGLRDTCMSPEEIAAQNFRINAGWTAFGAVLLFAAIALALHAVIRQARLSQMKSDFVSNVSHELRTPLSSIRVFGEYMRLGRVTKPEKIQEYGQYIEAESRRLTALINNILDFSKIESAEKKYRFDETDAVEAVAQTVLAFEVPLRDGGVTIALHPPAQPLPPVRLDRDALAQAVVNLLDNAVKYSGPRKELSVRISGERGELRIAVADRGIGIPLAEQKKIFDKFYRVGNSLVHDVKGSGLGLAIVNHIVKAHHGRVEVSSTPGEGSTFTIVLPLVHAPGTAAAPVHEAPRALPDPLIDL
jgi:signal transduction histidine kinase